MLSFAYLIVWTFLIIRAIHILAIHILFGIAFPIITEYHYRLEFVVEPYMLEGRQQSTGLGHLPKWVTKEWEDMIRRSSWFNGSSLSKQATIFAFFVFLSGSVSSITLG